MLLYFSALRGPFPQDVMLNNIHFGRDGGLIGRGQECTLILDDGERHVSRQHIKLTFNGQDYELEVLSEINPVFINEKKLGFGDRETLLDGDEVTIGPFVMRAHVTVPTPVVKPVVADTPDTGTASVDLHQAVQLLGQGMKHPVRLGSDVKPEAFLKRYGETMAELLEGTRKLTIQRAESKSEYVPTDRTMVSKVDTNPIKHASTRQDLFKLMFPEQDTTGLIDPVDAVREVMEDLRVHDGAMQAGMRAALNFVLQQLDPATIGEQKSGLLGMFGGGAMDAYKQKHKELREGVLRGKSSPVWDAFRDGYREEIKRHKSKGNPGNRTH